MLQYKRIDEYFCMDTFFATAKSGKSTRQNICCQIFVTDRGFIYVVPMKSISDVLQAVQQFAKEIGAPEAIIAESSKDQKSKELRQFLTEIGSTLRLLEENTPWAKKGRTLYWYHQGGSEEGHEGVRLPFIFMGLFP